MTLPGIKRIQRGEASCLSSGGVHSSEGLKIHASRFHVKGAKPGPHILYKPLHCLPT